MSRIPSVVFKDKHAIHYLASSITSLQLMDAALEHASIVFLVRRSALHVEERDGLVIVSKVSTETSPRSGPAHLHLVS